MWADVLRDVRSILELILKSGPLLNHKDGLDTGDVFAGGLNLAQLLARGGRGGLAAELEELLLKLRKLLEKLGTALFLEFVRLQDHFKKVRPNGTFYLKSSIVRN